jgi:cyanate permease
MPRPKILVVSLGGTITMTRDAAGGITPTLSAADLVRAVPGIESVAEIEAVSLTRIPGASLSLNNLLELAALIERSPTSGRDGVVVIQGTDTIEETAFTIAIMQPSMAAAVREWLPRRSAFATAVYTNGLIMGEIIPVATMLSLVLPYFAGNWRAALGIWALPLIATAAAVAMFAPKSATNVAARHAAPWFPQWNSRLNWRIMTSASAWTVFWAGVVGFSCGAALSLGLALAPLLCDDPNDVALTSAAALAIGYGFPMPVSFIAGVA